jgi:hypothetical protein
MRVCAWLCVIAGILVAGGAIAYAITETNAREIAWMDRETKSADVHRLRQVIRMVDEGARPAWVIVSPWPGVAAGAATTALGILILAIRRPMRKRFEDA